MATDFQGFGFYHFLCPPPPQKEESSVVLVGQLMEHCKAKRSEGACDKLKTKQKW